MAKRRRGEASELVDVLNEMRDRERRETDVDLVRTYNVWRKTGSQRARRLLRQHGVTPIAGGKFVRPN